MIYKVDFTINNTQTRGVYIETSYFTKKLTVEQMIAEVYGDGEDLINN